MPRGNKVSCDAREGCVVGAKDILLTHMDCQTVINDISYNTGGKHGANIKEIKARAEEFQVCSFIYESRSRNLKRTI